MITFVSHRAAWFAAPQALKGLASRLKEIQGYLQAVATGKLPVNHDIVEHLQVDPCLPSFFFCYLCVARG